MYAYFVQKKKNVCAFCWNKNVKPKSEVRFANGTDDC